MNRALGIARSRVSGVADPARLESADVKKAIGQAFQGRRASRATSTSRARFVSPPPPPHRQQRGRFLVTFQLAQTLCSLVAEGYDSTGCRCSFTTVEVQMLNYDDKRPPSEQEQ